MSVRAEPQPLSGPDPGDRLLDPGWVPDVASVTRALDGMILSASGWRTVFAIDGDEENPTSQVKPEHLLLAGIAARTFAEAVSDRKDTGRVLVGQDTRPTGSRLAQCAIRVFLGMGITPEYLWVTPSPEIMAATGTRDDVLGFFYVSASHNPIGHNGLKMGLSDGSVIGGAESAALIARFRELAAQPAAIAETADMLRRSATRPESDVLELTPSNKKRCQDAYREFTELVVRGPGPAAATAFDALTAALRAVRPGIVADMNGSARCLTIDRQTLRDAGCRFHSINDTAGQIRHQIVPEGKGLSQCVETLAALSKQDSSYFLGYVPDNDGDRGNLVFVEQNGSVRQLEAQEVFALAAVAEISWLHYTGAVTAGESGEVRSAIVVNGPTSMRIERIAEALGVEVHRAEVGEANVVGLARELRASGYQVRFLGEGSNGGNITHPATVRDPIQTVFAVLKLLHSPPRDGAPSPAQFWLARSGSKPAGTVSLSELVGSLPKFTTTSSFEERAVMKVRSADHGALKNEIERLWEKKWVELDDVRSRLGVSGYRYENYEGTVCRSGKGNRTGKARGGFKILLTDPRDRACAFLWMRGSGTEPVFRVMVDVEGDEPEMEERLLSTLRNLVSEADQVVVGG